jgi:type I pantothenate kinase
MTIVSSNPNHRLDVTDVARILEPMRPGAPPFIVGITGSVSVGKSTFAASLGAALTGRVEIAGTDGFLLPNRVLDARGLTMRKGFPESFDVEKLAAALTLSRPGPVEFPGYSHVTYDVDAALARRIDGPDVLIIEGLGLGPHRNAIDALIYLDAEEADLEAWFIARFLGLWAAAEHDPTSFYVRFRGLDPSGAAQAARTVWAAINLPNLRDHISPQRELADIVVRKSADHEIVAILERHGQATRL